MPFFFHYIASYGIALIGVALFHYFALPLPWLLGTIFACLIAALCGFRFKVVKIINTTMRTILGVAVGASVTIGLLSNMLDIWLSLLFVILMVVVIALVGIPYFYRLCKYDFATSYYATMPGGLQDMLIFGQEAGANLRALSLIHATRVMVVVVGLPIILTQIWGVDLHQPPGQPAVEIAIDQIALMIVAGIIGWKVAEMLGLFGASILGPLILAAIFSLTGLLNHRPPAEAIWAAQFFIGITVGSNYSGITTNELKRDILSALGFCVLLSIITAVFFMVVSLFNFTDDMNILLAFTPGGQAEITVLTIIVAADISFVITHHLLRIFFVITMAPIAERLFNKIIISNRT